MAVNIKSIKILSIKVTDEHVHGSKAVPELVENIIKYDDMTKTTTIITIGKLFSDGTYEGNDLFRYLGDKGIQSCIKVRWNTIIKWK
jgi:hypothetical protein